MSAKSLRMERECESATGEGGCAALNGTFQDTSHEQRADRRPQRAVRPQGQEAAVRQMEHQLRERDETIRALRQELDVRMRLVEGRMDVLEDQFRQFRGKEEGESGSKQRSKEPLDTKIVKKENSAGSALGGTVFPRVDALVAELENRLPLRMPCAAQSPPVPVPVAVSPSSSLASTSSDPGPSGGAVGATTASKAEAAGARKEPASSCRGARASEEERERQRVELQLRQASAKVERALAALGLA